VEGNGYGFTKKLSQHSSFMEKITKKKKLSGLIVCQARFNCEYKTKNCLDGMWKEMVMASLRNYLSTHPSWRTEQKTCQDGQCARWDSTVNTRWKSCFFRKMTLFNPLNPKVEQFLGYLKSGNQMSTCGMQIH